METIMLQTFILGDGTPLAYRLDGDVAAPVLILSNSIATDHTMSTAPPRSAPPDPARSCPTTPAPRYFDAQIAGLREQAPMEAMAETFLGNWFPAALRDENGPTIRRFRAMILRTPPQGLAGAFAAVRDADLRRPIALIERPTLVVGGDHDTVTLPEHSRQIAAAVPGAQLVMLPSVHLPNVEKTRAYEEVVLGFLLAGD